MLSIPMKEVMLVVYFLVDGQFQAEGHPLLKGKPGVKLVFSDSEVIMLILVQDFIPYPGETQYLGYLRANYLDLFPKLLTQSQSHRPARNLGLLVEALQRHWLSALGLLMNQDLLLDTKPMPVMGYKRSNKHSVFAGSAGYGGCQPELKYYDYKLVTFSALEGLPLVSELGAAKLDERVAAQAVAIAYRAAALMTIRGYWVKHGNTNSSNTPATACSLPN